MLPPSQNVILPAATRLEPKSEANCPAPSRENPSPNAPKRCEFQGLGLANEQLEISALRLMYALQPREMHMTILLGLLLGLAKVRVSDFHRVRVAASANRKMCYYHELAPQIARALPFCCTRPRSPEQGLNGL